MPRSWSKVRDNLVHEVQETVRIQFKHIRIEQTHFKLLPTAVYYDVHLETEVYGGVTVLNEPELTDVNLAWEAETQPLSTHFEAHVNNENAAVTAPCIQVVPPLTEIKPTLIAPVVHFAMPRIQNQPVDALVKPVPKTVIVRYLTTQILSWGLDQLKKPRVRRLQLLKAKIKPASYDASAFPIARKAIPFHRFSLEARSRFRDQLAKKAGLPVQDVLLLQVYDRVFLGLVQSLAQNNEGDLLITPKSTAALTGNTKEIIPVYLIMGKTITQPNRMLQAIIPMAEGL